jgi:hypothetical protein
MRRLAPTFRYGAFFFVASALADVSIGSLNLARSKTAATLSAAVLL